MHYTNLNGCNFKNALEYIAKFGLVFKKTLSRSENTSKN